MKRLSSIIFFISVCFYGQAQKAVIPQAVPGINFAENIGQWENNVLFRAGLDGGALFLEQNKLTFNFYDKRKYRQHHAMVLKPEDRIDDEIKGHGFSVEFENCNLNSTVEKQQKGSYYENYFLGSNKNKWKGNVSHYHQLFYRNLYDNIDYEIITAINNVKYNFHVKPGGNASEIKLKYEGITNIQLKKGALIIKPEVNELFEQKPYAYQVINDVVKEISCRFVLSNNTLSYNFPEGYNKNYELVIDPLLVFAAQSGSTADNFGMTATYDANGNLYSGGTVFNVGYPTTLGAYSSSFFGPQYYGNTDVVITKYNATGSSLLFSTYIGGESTETVHSLIVDKNDNLCFYGVTSSISFPTTVGAYDNSFNGGAIIFFYNNGQRFNNGTDIYISKFNTNGTVLLSSTYIGGSGNDGINHTNSYISHTQAPNPVNPINVLYEPKYDSLFHNYGDQCRGEIQLDNQNNIYVTSSTRSIDFPTINGFDNSLGGLQDGVIIKLNSNLTTLISSSYIGGSSNDAGYGLVIDNNNEVFVTGGTCSKDLPHTTGGYQPTYQGGIADGYIYHLSTSANSVLNGTYFGTSKYDQTYFIQSDKQNNIYVFGQSYGNMPVLKATNSATVFSVPKTHQFISKLNNSLTALKMSTVFGSDTISADISPSAFAVDKCSNIYLSGWGSNFLINVPPLNEMPLLNATQNTTDGHDFYLMALDSNAAALKYGSYFGGGISREHVDGGTSRFDPKGAIYQSVCAGCGGSSTTGAHQDFPVTPGAWPNTPGYPNHNTNNYNCNNGVFKIDFQLLLAISTINTNTVSGCGSATINFTNANPGSSYLWYLGNGDTTSFVASPSVTYTNPGTYSVSLVVVNPVACNTKDSSTIVVTIFPIPNVAFTSTSSVCSNTIVATNTSSGTFGTNPFVWNFGDTSPTSTLTSVSHTYSSNGIYTVSLTGTSINGCSATATQTISVFNFTSSVLSSSVCLGSATTLTASGGTSYTWQPTSLISNANSTNPTSSPSVTTIYTVQINNNSSGYLCTKTLTTQVIVKPNNTPSFNFTVFPCTDSVLFVNTSTTAASSQSVTWHFGGSIPSTTNTSVTQHYASGTYTVNLVATNNFGCKDSIMKTVTVFIFNPTIVKGDSICYGVTKQLSASGGSSYTWSPSVSLNNAFIASPIASPTITTTYTVNIVNNSAGYNCVKTLTTSIKVYPQITSSFTYSIGGCSNDVQFTDGSTPTPVNWQWNYGDGNNSIIQNPLYYYSAPGSYTASLIVTNSFGCKDTSYQVIPLIGFTPISVNASLLKCERDTVQLQATGGVKYVWAPIQYLTNSTISNPKAFPPVTTIYTVTISTLHGTDTCTSLITTTVSVFPFTYNANSITVLPTPLIFGQTATITLSGFTFTGNITLLPTTTFTIINNNTILLTPTKSGEYSIYFTDQNNCRHLLKTIFIDVQTNECNEGTVYLPTGFTPNGDGTNDVLYIRSNFITDVYLTIYDRWGEKLFETSDVKIGWDGVFKGKQLDQGVYGYYMTFKCNNGQESFKKGNITLMR